MLKKVIGTGTIGTPVPHDKFTPLRGHELLSQFEAPPLVASCGGLQGCIVSKKVSYKSACFFHRKKKEKINLKNNLVYKINQFTFVP